MRAIGFQLYRFLHKRVRESAKSTAALEDRLKQLEGHRTTLEELKAQWAEHAAKRPVLTTTNDNGSPRNPLEILRKQIDDLKVRETKIRKTLESLGLKEESEIERAVVELFLFGGTDVKGRVNLLVGSSGISGGIKLELNPLGVLGVLAKLEVDVGGARLHTCAPMVIRMPARCGDSIIERPVSMLFFKGTTWERSVKAQFEIGVGFEAGWELVAGEEEELVTSKETAEQINEEEIDEDTNFELCSAHVEAKISAAIGGDVTRKSWFGYSPARYSARADRTEGFRAHLPRLLAAGSDEAEEVENAIDLVNEIDGRIDHELEQPVPKPWHEKKAALFDAGGFNVGKLCSLEPAKTSLGGRNFHLVETANQAYKILKTFPYREKETFACETVVARNQRIEEAREKVDRMLERLAPFASPDGGCLDFLYLMNTDGGVGAEVYAGANASANLLGLARLDTEAKGRAEIAGRRTWATARFQTACPTPDKKVWVGMTVESKIAYSRIVLSGELGWEASARLYKKNGELKDVREGEHAFLNRLTYECATLYWELKSKTEYVSVDKGEESERWGKGGQKKRVTTQTGTGIAYGASYLVKTLVDLYRAKKNKDAKPGDKGESGPQATVCRTRKKNEKTLLQIAEHLHVTVDQVVTFFNCKEVQTLLVHNRALDSDGEDDPLQSIRFEEDGSVLIEACFQVELPSPVHLYKSKEHGESFKNWEGETVQIKFPTPDTKLLERFREAPKKTLESIRLRYRLCDHDRKETTRFTLGTGKVVGNALSIDIRDVSEAGSDAIIDLVTCYFDDELAKIDNPVEAAERAVPGAILFTQ